MLLIICSIFLSGFYGIIDEFHQSFVSYRVSDFWDVLADIIGSICGVLLYQVFVAVRELGLRRV